MEIDGIGAVVTGGASGLGEAAARRLAAMGARVTILDRDEVTGVATAAAIGGRFARVDVTDERAVEAALGDAEAAHGLARVLVNCAGVASVGRIVGRDGAPLALDAFRRTVEVNLIGTFNVLSRVAARIVAAGAPDEEAGVIVNTASIAAYDGQVGQAAYAASKGGVVGLTLAAARDLAQHRIRVMTIAPGLFRTPMLAGLPQAAQDSLGQQVPHPSRLGRPDEYADLVAAIVATPMLNGEVIRLDGAVRMAPR